MSRETEDLREQIVKKKYNIDNLQMVTDSEGNVVYKDPHLFYLSFGKLMHPYTRQIVDRLTPYQYEWWNDIVNNQYNIAIKSNKIGLSTITLMALFQNCLLREGAGNEKLVIAQTSQMAKDHLYTLRRAILASPTFKHTLIMRPGKYLLKDEVTKVTQLFIHNPYEPARPSRIIALGASAGMAVSWKNVDFIHVSDITKAQIDYTEVIDGAFTRLAMSRGKFVIETIPRGPRGKIYSLWQDATAKPKKNSFIAHKYPIEMAIEAGLVSQDHIDEERRRLGAFFPEYYGAEFISVGGNVFVPEHVDRATKLFTELPAYPGFDIISLPKSMGVDPAFGSDSTFAICVTMKRPDGIVEVVDVQEFQRQDHETMCKFIVGMMHRLNITKVYIDAQMQSVADKLKEMQNDQVSPDDMHKKATPFHQLKWSKYKINPIRFGGAAGYGMQMIQHAQRIFAENLIAIDPRFGNLVTQLKTATLVNPSGEAPSLDKETYGTMDIFDAFRLSLINYGWEKMESYT